jgi:hypothetical protein
MSVQPASKLDAYLQLADEVCALTEQIATRATELLASREVKQGLRERVLTGLALKIDSAFRALIVDARAQRSEAMHHLKTMVESFIYFHFTVRDPSDRTAASVLARALHDKCTFLRENPGYAPEDHIAWWKSMRNSLLQQAGVDVKNSNAMRAELRRLRQIERLAKVPGPELSSWYSRVYRLACAPAHLGDLLEFMPPGNPIRTGSPATAGLQAHVAIDYALHLMLAIIRPINETNSQDLHVPIVTFEQRLRDIREAK